MGFGFCRCRFRFCVVSPVLNLWIVFFFKQKTAYEMRISDWSSDVCSSDLIARDDDPHREAGPDRERRRNVELAPNDFLTGLIDAVLRTGAQRTDQSVVASRSELRSNTQHRRDHRGPSETAPMKVHAVLQTGEAATIGTGLAVELDGASIGQDQPRPGEQDAGLPGANLSVILTDQPRALRDQQDAARGADRCI